MLSIASAYLVASGSQHFPFAIDVTQAFSDCAQFRRPTPTLSYALRSRLMSPTLDDLSPTYEATAGPLAPGTRALVRERATPRALRIRANPSPVASTFPTPRKVGVSYALRIRRSRGQLRCIEFTEPKAPARARSGMRPAARHYSGQRLSWELCYPQVVAVATVPYPSVEWPPRHTPREQTRAPITGTRWGPVARGCPSLGPRDQLRCRCPFGSRRATRVGQTPRRSGQTVAAARSSTWSSRTLMAIRCRPDVPGRRPRHCRSRLDPRTIVPHQPGVPGSPSHAR